jgi:hypothetical protein
MYIWMDEELMVDQPPMKVVLVSFENMKNKKQNVY